MEDLSGVNLSRFAPFYFIRKKRVGAGLYFSHLRKKTKKELKKWNMILLEEELTNELIYFKRHKNGTITIKLKGAKNNERIFKRKLGCNNRGNRYNLHNDCNEQPKNEQNAENAGENREEQGENV